VKPNFLVIGAGRCGTTNLCALLGQHPEVFMCEPKEPGFFTEFYDRGWPWYESLFQKAADSKAIGEGSNNYSKCRVFPQALPRIAWDLPDLRLLYIVRHPLRRIESDWRYSRLCGVENLPFEAAVRTVPKYVDTSDYMTQVDGFRQHYAEERIKVVFLDDLCGAPEWTLAECFAFLGVDPSFRVSCDAQRNSALAGLRDRWSGALLRRLPWAERLFRRLPRGLRERLRPLMQAEVSAEAPVWTPALLAEVRSRLAPGSVAFLERYSRGARSWSFEPAAALAPEARAA
jgi:hypothetical protein